MFGNDYKSRRVVVTGAASGMGAAACKLLLECGAEVIGADINAIDNPDITGYQMNLMDQASIDAFVAEQENESIYAVFCCAGLPQTFPPVDVVQVNFLGNRYLIEAILPKLQSESAIAVITSMTLGWVQDAERLSPLINSKSMEEGRAWVEASLESLGDSYIAAKHALAAWATINSTRYIQRGTRLNVLCPGITQTPMLASFYEAAPEAMAMLPQPLGRETTAQEQAFAMLFLNHPRASALVGLSLYNDGGSQAAILSAAAAGLM
jgi:NAD(P)-dependent dehydrogenase (short-subunit alcohol dehydrogenase family)